MNHIYTDALKLSYSKGNFVVKFLYLIKAFCFLPFIIKEEKLQNNIPKEVGEAIEFGDDIYPIF